MDALKVSAFDSRLLMVNTSSGVVQELPYVIGFTLLLLGLNVAGVPDTLVLGSVEAMATMWNDAPVVDAADAGMAPTDANNAAAPITAPTTPRLAVVSIPRPPCG